MFQVIHKALLHLPAEIAHNLSLQALQNALVKKQILSVVKDYEINFRAKEVAGLNFENPIGLAAGLDKNAEAISVLSHLGFSHIEVGTVTPKPQDGNPKPRLFRLKKEKSLLNRMGFNNKGSVEVLNNILAQEKKERVLLGVNIGKNKITPNENAIDDYKYLLDIFSKHSDYITVNLSSPNTPGLRDLQSRNFLEELNALIQPHHKVFIKLAPDMEDAHFFDLIDLLNDLSFSGIILTNTTTVTNYPEIEKKFGSGGISGDLLRILSREALLKARKRTNLPIISVGGIDSADEIRWRMDRGADLVQIYSAWIYHGPFYIQKLLEDLRKNGI